MDIQVRFSNLTPAQQAQEDLTYKAAKLLREAGIACEVRLWFASSPSSDVASIIIAAPTEPRHD